MELGLAERVSRLFSAHHLNDKSQYLLLRYLVFASIVRAFLALSSTFLVLYVLDAVGYATAGLLIAINLGVQAIFDYPTGILSDWLGQRSVLIMAYGSYGISFLIFSMSNSYIALIFAYVFFAFATAQESGTLISWFDNNYKFITPEDSERSTYKTITGKARTLVDLFGGLMILFGGWLATTYSRVLVFQIQVFVVFFVLLSAYLLIYDFDGYERNHNPGVKYLHLLKNGVTSIFQSKLLTLFVFAGVFFQISMGIFGSLLIFPIYFGYTGTDFGASVFRFSLFIAGSVALWLIADFVGRLPTKKWLPRVHIAHSFLLLSGLYLLFYTTPISNSFNLRGIIIAWIVIFVTHMLRVVVNIYVRRVYLDIIPDSRRNGFYSFQPTLVLLFQAPFVLQSGTIIEDEGFLSIVLFIGVLGFISSILYVIAVRSLGENELSIPEMDE